MRGSVDITISAQASKDLKDLGRWKRGLVMDVIGDQFVVAARSKPMKLESKAVEDLIPHEARQAAPADDSEWVVLPVGDYRALVQFGPTTTPGELGGFVGRIVPESALSSQVQPAVGQAGQQRLTL